MHEGYLEVKDQNKTMTQLGCDPVAPLLMTSSSQVVVISNGSIPVSSISNESLFNADQFSYNKYVKKINIYRDTGVRCKQFSLNVTF